jgi:hypothetical protein
MQNFEAVFHILVMGAKVEAWCLLIHAEASVSPILISTAWIQALSIIRHVFHRVNLRRPTVSPHVFDCLHTSAFLSGLDEAAHVKIESKV